VGVCFYVYKRGEGGGGGGGGGGKLLDMKWVF